MNIRQINPILWLMICTLTCGIIQSAYAQTSLQKLSLGAFENINIEKHQSILLITIDNPPRNAVSRKTLAEINKVLDYSQNNQQVKGIIITGSNGMFSSGAGADSASIQLKGDDTHAFLAREVYNRIERFPKLIIAAISGISAGGGNELAMACDIRIASSDARFAQPELEVGLIPGFGGMQRLQRHVGLGRAMDIMLTGRIVKADEALSIGLISSITSEKSLKQTAISLATQLTNKLNANALTQFKQRMAISADEPFGTSLRNDQLTFDRIFYSEEGQAALKEYIEKKKRQSTN